ncbi:MAG: F0F1 ATP synthase subunit A [Geobacteraceae bacterium]|jgi:F-type H+-transporting ATPase subunit a
MVHPFLFLQYFRGILVPLLFPAAVNVGGEALENAHKAVDTITYTWLVMVFLIILSLLTTKGLKRMPGRLQNFMELLFGTIENMVTETLGKNGKAFFPLIATLFLFILISNLFGLLPGFLPPTASINTTLALAVIVVVLTHVVGISKHGFGYIKHFLGPVWWLAWMIFIIEVISHISRVLSLSLRLFGNIGGHELVIMVVFMLVPLFVPLVMTVLGLLVAVIQSVVFMYLSMIYIQGAAQEAH